MEASIRQRKMTLAQYVRFEEHADLRHEFDNGKLIEMPGTTDTHNDICHNIKAAMRKKLKETNCRIQVENVKVRIIENKRYTYPDVFVTCDERDDADRYVKRYPSVIFEVLSDSTRVYDKTEKFLLYKKIESLQHYILVETNSVDIEIFTKNEKGSWDAQTVNQLSDKLDIPALNITILLTDIYE